MNRQQPKDELHAAIQKMGDRLVELKFAARFLWDSQRKIGRVLWTEKGMALADAVMEIYEVHKGHSKPIAIPELVALTGLILSCESIE